MYLNYFNVVSLIIVSFWFLAPLSANESCDAVLISAEGTDNQSICFVENIEDIQYQIIAGTLSDITGLPEGVNWEVSEQIINISGTPENVGSFSYQILINGIDCEAIIISGSINVNPIPDIIITTNELTICSSDSTYIQLSSSNDNDVLYTWLVNVVEEPDDGSIIGITDCVENCPDSIVQKTTNTGKSPGVITYSITPWLNSCIGASENVSYVINPTAQVNPILSQELCNGNLTEAIEFSTINIEGITTYSWVNDNTEIGLSAGANNVSQILPFMAINLQSEPIIANISVTPLYENLGIQCDGLSEDFTIQVNPTPTINTETTKLICNNTSVDYIIGSESDNTTFTWTSSLLTSPQNGTISGFSDCLDNCDPNIQDILENTGTSSGIVRYEIVATGPNPTDCPGEVFFLDVTVNPTPTVYADSQTVCSQSETNIVLSTTIFEPNLYYTWSAEILTDVEDGELDGFEDCNDNCGEKIMQELSNTGTNPGVVRYTITPWIGTCMGDQISIDVTVNPLGTMYAPDDQVYCHATLTEEIVFTSNQTEGIVSYSWTNSNTNIGNLPDSGEGNLPKFITENLTTQPIFSNIHITPVFTYNQKSCPGPQEVFQITINQLGQVNQPQDFVVCNGEDVLVVFSSENSGGTNHFYWTNSNPDIGLDENGNGMINFEASNSYNEPISAIIEVIPEFFNEIACPGEVKTFTLTVNPTAQVNQIENQELCNGELTNAIVFSTVNNGGLTTYSWENDNTDIGLGNGENGVIQIDPFTVSNDTSYPIIANITVKPYFKNLGVECTGQPESFSIKVNPTPVILSEATKQLCNNAIVDYSIISNTDTTTFTWTSSLLTSPQNGTISGFSDCLDNCDPNIQDILENTGTSSGIVRYEIIATGPDPTYCLGEVFYLDVTVNPIPTVYADSQTVCSQSETNIVLSTTIFEPNVNYTWSAEILTNVEGGELDGFEDCNDNCGDKIVQELSNTGTNPGVLRYTITPWIDTCIGTPISIDVTVNPLGTMHPTDDQVYCHATHTEEIEFTSGQTEGIVSYSWTNSNPGIGNLPDSGEGNLPEFITENLNTQPVFSNIYITPVFTYNHKSCPGPQEVFQITINQLGQVNQPQDLVVCNGEDVLVVFSSENSGGTNHFYWTNSNPDTGLDDSGEELVDFMATNAFTYPIESIISVVPVFTNQDLSCEGTEKEFSLTVMPVADVITNPPEQTICTMGDAYVELSTNITGTSVLFSWTGTVIEGDATGFFDGDGSIIAQTLLNNTYTIAKVEYEITPFIGNCVGTSSSALVNINPMGQVITPPDMVFCDNSLSNEIILETENTGGITTFEWNNNNTVIGLPDSGSGNIPSFHTNNPETHPLVADITIEPTFTYNEVGCSGNEKSFFITINPLGQVNQIQNQELCHDETTETVIFTTNNTVGETTYKWLNDSPQIGLPEEGNGNIPSFVAKNYNNQPYEAFLTVIPTFTYQEVSCAAHNDEKDRVGFGEFQITVNNLPDTVFVHGPDYICQNQSDLFYYFENANPGYMYNWFANNLIILTETDSNSIVAKSPKINTIDTLYLSQKIISTGCQNIMKYPIYISENLSPNKTEIIWKTGSNLLVCSDTTEFIKYQWGYDVIKTGEINFIEGANLQYVVIPHDIDTITYRYWVQTYFEYENDQKCITQSFYNNNPFPTNIEELSETHTINIFPNPTTGVIYLQYDMNVFFDIKIYNIYRKEAQYNWNKSSKSLHLYSENPNGLYFIIFRKKNGTVPKRVILQR